MKLKNMIPVIIALGIMMINAGLAEEFLTARLDGNILKIEWGARGECVLTVYRNGWPEVVRNVDGEAGGAEICVEPVGQYSVRLRTENGCFSTEVTKTAKKQTEIDDKQTGVVNNTPATEAAQKPTMLSTGIAAQKPTEVSIETAGGASVDRLSNSQSMTSMAAAVIGMVNEERAKYGLQPLNVSAQLMSAASVRAHEIARKFSHTRPDGSAWSSVSSAAKGENIARGQATAQRVMAAWMTSEGHRKNILRESFGSIGVCALKVNGVIHWVQLFGK